MAADAGSLAEVDVPVVEVAVGAEEPLAESVTADAASSPAAPSVSEPAAVGSSTSDSAESPVVVVFSSVPNSPVAPGSLPAVDPMPAEVSLDVAIAGDGAVSDANAVSGICIGNKAKHSTTLKIRFPITEPPYCFVRRPYGQKASPG